MCLIPERHDDHNDIDYKYVNNYHINKSTIKPRFVKNAGLYLTIHWDNTIDMTNKHFVQLVIHINRLHTNKYINI